MSGRGSMHWTPWNGDGNMWTVDNKFYPITTDREPAPDYIMKVVRCTCTSGCKPLACSCMNVGFEFSSACSTNKGLSCENVIQPYLEIEELNRF